ncbi:hypothetical protein EG329_014011 [Mollisiaceae sp. DMI_Dod_QoI]|nr:hypothetical protein EG329_014011 [Helotiales sp. DMI_Dod_QoI]
MAGSILSSPSIRNSATREVGPQRKKRARGRPLKDAGQSNIPEERRAQVRKAQEAFRQRKQAAVRSLEQRAEALENCVEQISKVFLSFSDSMLKSQMVQKDPELGKSLLSTTSRIVDLARTAGADESRHLQSDYGEFENSINAQAEDGVSISKAFSDSDSTQSNSSIKILHSCPPSISHSTNLFGNGWFGYEPEFFRRAKANSETEVPVGSFGLRLIRTNLEVAYYALLDETGAHTSLITQMFRYAFLYHTREEILSNLRWFLEHGIPAQRYLGRAVFGFDTLLSLQHLNVIYEGVKPRVFHPLVDAHALLEADYTSPVSPFLNAFDVEEYLVAKGAFHMDDEFIHMRTSKEENQTNVESEKYGFGKTRSSAKRTINPVESADLSGSYGTFHGTATGNAGSLNTIDSVTLISASVPTTLLNTESTDHETKPKGKHCEIFDFNALLKDTNNQSIMREAHDQKGQESSPKRWQSVSLSVPFLLDNLIRNSICLGTGPGYPRSSIDIAIQSSMIPSTLPC